MLYVGVQKRAELLFGAKIENHLSVNIEAVIIWGFLRMQEGLSLMGSWEFYAFCLGLWGGGGGVFLFFKFYAGV